MFKNPLDNKYSLKYSTGIEDLENDMEEDQGIQERKRLYELSVLQKATEYDGVEKEEEHIAMFWEALEGMSPEEQAQFVNFCSGRSRLPPSAAQFPMTFKLQAPHPQSRADPDKYLPIAQTCFFSLSLPKYSSIEVMRSKLLYAIGNTDLMDADFLMRQGDGWAELNN